MDRKARFVFPVVITAIVLLRERGGDVLQYRLAERFFDPLVVRLRRRLAHRGHRLSRDPLRQKPHPAHRRRYRKPSDV